MEIPTERNDYITPIMSYRGLGLTPSSPRVKNIMIELPDFVQNRPSETIDHPNAKKIMIDPPKVEPAPNQQNLQKKKNIESVDITFDDPTADRRGLVVLCLQKWPDAGSSQRCCSIKLYSCNVYSANYGYREMQLCCCSKQRTRQDYCCALAGCKLAALCFYLNCQCFLTSCRDNQIYGCGQRCLGTTITGCVYEALKCCCKLLYVIAKIRER